jgi:anti-sigma factor RsiW
MPCSETLRVHAHFDDELDTLAVEDIERHSDACAACRALLQDLIQVRTALRRVRSDMAAPRALRARIVRMLDTEGKIERARRVAPPRTRRPPSPFWRGATIGVGGSAIAAGLTFLLLAPPLTYPVVNDLVSAHVRSLMPDHLIDVVSTDRHTVKPWFAGHTDVSPVVADFAPQGYRLIGGRADYFEHQRVAVVVYQHGTHIINIFCWAADVRDVPGNTTRDGYHLAYWKAGNLLYAAVSDIGWDQLSELARLLQELEAQPTP